ncbi:MAG TPA: hypothetical protein PK156_07875 [Polyangium sp.]|nr:hypothetical protein [Polyangium sp.]
MHLVFRRMCGAVAIFGFAATSPCGSLPPGDDSCLIAPTNPADIPEQYGISLLLSVDQSQLRVGDELHVRLAFHNASAQTAFIIPSINGSWDEMEQPEYSLEFSDAAGKPVQYPFGYRHPARNCGNADRFRPEHRRLLGAQESIEIEEALLCAPRLRVLEYARPGEVWMRVRYRADKLPNLEPINIVSNAVKLTIRGGNEEAWACRNALVEKAKNYDYAENVPSKLMTYRDGYLLVYRRDVTHIRANNLPTVSWAIFVQPLGFRGESLGDPVEIAQGEGEQQWSCEMDTLEVPDGVLIAFTTMNAAHEPEVRLVHIKATEKTLGAGVPHTLAKELGTLFSLRLARAGNLVGIVWQNNLNKHRFLRFRPLDLEGIPVAAPMTIASGNDIWPERLLLQPIANDFVLLWHEWGTGFRLQRLTANGRAVGPRGTFAFEQHKTPVALGELGDKLRLVYVTHDDAIEYVDLHAQNFESVSKVPFNPHQSADEGAATWLGRRIVGIWRDWHELTLASVPQSPPLSMLLSKTLDRQYSIQLSPGRDKLLATWMDFRDDDVIKCKAEGRCVSEAYIAVFDSQGQTLLAPQRITKTAIPQQLPVERVNFVAHCGGSVE